MKRNSVWKKMAAVFWAVLLCGELLAAPLLAAAPDRQKTAPAQRAAAATTAVSTAAPAAPTAPEGGAARAPKDITQTQELALDVAKALPGDGSGVELAPNNGTLDLSGASTAATITFALSFSFLRAPEVWDVRPGDTFAFRLPTEGFVIENTQEAILLYNRAGENGAQTQDLLGTYQIANGVLTVTLGDLFAARDNLPQIVGRIDVAAAWNPAALTPQTTKQISWQLSDARSLTLVLPAAPDAAPQPGEITNRMDEVRIGLASMSYLGAVFVNENDTIEAMLAPGETQATLEYTLQLAAQDTLRAGDTVVLQLPAFAACDEALAVEVYQDAQSAAQGGAPADASAAAQQTTQDSAQNTPQEPAQTQALLGEITAVNGEAVLTLAADVKNAAATVQLPVQLDEQAIAALPEGKQSLTLQKDAARENTVLFRFAPLRSTLEEPPQQPAPEPPEQRTKSASMRVEWLDYAADKRPRLLTADTNGEVIDGLIRVEYSSDNGATWLPLPADEAMPEFTKTSTGVGFETYTSESTLPDQIDGVDVTYRAVQTRGQYTDDAAYKKAYGYMPPQKDANGNYVNIACTTFTLVVDVKDGDKNAGTHKTITDFAPYITLNGLVDNLQAGALSFPFKDVSWEQKTGTDTVVVTGLPMFDANKKEYVYSAQITGGAKKVELPGMQAGDYYEPTYLNEKSPNFGSVTTKTHDQGTLRLILTGETTYAMKKHWLDEKTTSEEFAKRPDATLYLWRYTDRPGYGYAQAAQVKGKGSNANVSHTLNKTSQTENVTLDLGSSAPLPKYDPEGYLYVYFTREELKTVKDGDTYEQAFGAINADGSILPGSDPVPTNSTRDTKDQCVYNGGNLSNRIKGEVRVNAEKTWKAAVYQNDLADVAVTFALESKTVKGTDAWARTGKTIVLDGFIAEGLTQKDGGSYPKYSPQGKELEYRWVEEGITENGAKVNLTTGTDGKTTFSLSHNGSQPAYEKEWYESTAVTEKDPVTGIMTTKITNQLKGTTEYTVDKLWEDTANPGTYNKNPPQGATVTVTLRNDLDGTVYTYKMDGVKDTTPGGAEFAPYSLHITNLPKYNADGRKYSYIADEVAIATGWYASYQYNVTESDPSSPLYGIALPDDHKGIWDCQIKNSIASPGNTIKVRKVWRDAGDEPHREPVHIQVYQNDGTPVGGPVKLTAENGWWTYVSTGAIADDPNSPKFYIREVSVGKNREYAVVPDPTVSIDQKPSDTTVDTVKATHHTYEVTYPTGLRTGGEYQVYNRRVGTVGIDVSKTWVDEGVTTTTRPQATLVLNIVEKESGAIEDKTVDLKDGKSVPIHDKDGNPSTSRLPLDTNIASGTPKTYYFYNLPKYDALGRVVHYTVTEEWTNNQKGDYANTISSTYTVDTTSDDKDKQTVTVLNKRVGTKPVTFKKHWKDAYAFKNGKRPDIYLTLYSSTPGGTIQEMSEYKNRKWVYDTNNGDYQWTCDFGNLPKYDKDGREIIYYATEGMAVTGAAFDYTDVQLSDPVYLDAQGQIVQENDSTKVLTVLKESGTFTNAIENSVTIQGKKVWKNVPSGFPNAQLPTVTLTVTQEKEDKSIVNSAIASIVLAAPTAGEAKVWEFTVTHTGVNVSADNLDANGKPQVPSGKTALPKYNDKGELFVYGLTEVMKLKPGAEAGSAGDIYKYFQSSIYSYIVENIYGEKATGKLTLEKTWDMSAVGSSKNGMSKKYPVLTFTVDRRAPDLTGSGYTAWETAVAKATLDCNKTPPADADGKATLTIDNLPIYAPSGKKYVYRITEAKVNGYQTKCGSTATVADGLTVEGLEAKADEIIDAYFKNTYTPDTITLQGEKVWNDFENAFSTRPDVGDLKLRLRLLRYAPQQPGASGGIGDNLKPDREFGKGQGYIAIDSFTPDTQNESRWSYEVTGLERYAPNGMSWLYVVQEYYLDTNTASPENETWGKYYDIATKDKDGNPVSPKTATQKAAATETNKTVTMKPLENSTQKSFTVTKEWSAGSGGGLGQHGLRPPVVMELQMKIGDSGAWAPAKTALAAYKNWGTALGDKTLSPSGTDTTATDTWGNLPAYLLESGKTVPTPLYYRAVEKSIKRSATDIIPVTSSDAQNSNDPNYAKAWVYEIASSTTVEEGVGKTDATKITNTFSDTAKTQLKVIKNWVSDGANKYATRPGGAKWEITVKLQSSTGSGTFTDVKDVAGKVITKTLNVTNNVAGDANRQVLLIEDLPALDAAGNQLTYRAVEIEAGKPGADGDGVTTLGSYGVAHDHTAAQGADPDTSAITNTLGYVELTVTKTWAGEDSVGGQLRPNALALTLWQHVKGEAAAKDKDVTTQYGAIPNPVETPSDTWTYTFTGMPRKTADGKELVYYVKETTPDHYKAPVYGTLDESNAGQQAQTYTITNTLTQIALAKTDEQDATLYGYTFEIWQGATHVATWDCDENGTITSTLKAKPGVAMSSPLYGLSVGKTYTLEETKAPAGHTRAPDVSFQLESDGTITTTPPIGSHVTVNNTMPTPTLTVKDAKTAFAVEKWANDTTTTPAQKTSKLADATLALFEADGKTPVQQNGSNLEWTSGQAPSPDRWVITGLPVGTYVLRETVTPAGYVTARDVTFTLETAQVIGVTDITLNTTEDVLLAKDGNMPVLQVLDDQIYGSVTLTKTQTGSIIPVPVPGAKFDLYEKKTTSTPDVKKGSHTTDASGKITVKNLPVGEYYFKETAAPAGYVLSGIQVPFTIAANSDSMLQPVEIKVSAQNTPFTAAVTLQKQDKDTGAPLKGAEFKLVGPAPETTEIQKTTDSNGNLQFDLTRKGNYTITETKAAAGYSLNKNKPYTVTFTLGDAAHGQTLVLADKMNVSMNGFTGIAVQNAAGANTAAVTNARKVEILKIAAGSPDIALSGAEFTLNGKLVGGGNEFKWTSGDTPEVLSDLLLPNETYTVTETKAPVGYVPITIHKVYTFTLDALGNVASCTPTTGVVLAGNRISIENEPIKLKIAKNGADTNQPLQGCVFSITGVFAPAPTQRSGVRGWLQALASGLGVQTTIDVSDADPNALEGRLIAGNSYVLKEKIPPNGYQVGGEVTFQVENNGQITMGASANGEYTFSNASGEIKITMVDDPIHVELRKTDEAGTPLAGAQLTVHGVFAGGAGAESRTFTTDSAGRVDLLKQVNESATGVPYVLTESKAPEGHELLTAEIPFRVYSKGVIKLDGGTAGEMVSVSQQNGVYIVTMKNKKASDADAAGQVPPKTGDALPRALGALLAASALVLAVAVRKKRNAR